MGAAINWALDVCYHLITVNESSDVPISRLPTQRWQRPPSNTLKVNIDAAFVAETNAGAIGAVARDDAGDFLMAMTKRLPAVASALAAEAEALRAGVQLIYSVSHGSVIMETDSLELVGLWNNKETQRSEFTPIFSDIQEMSSSFSSFYVVHARRSANKAAHVCASYAEHSAFDVWANDPPSFLLQILQDDCNHSDE